MTEDRITVFYSDEPDDLVLAENAAVIRAAATLSYAQINMILDEEITTEAASEELARMLAARLKNLLDFVPDHIAEKARAHRAAREGTQNGVST